MSDSVSLAYCLEYNYIGLLCYIEFYRILQILLITFIHINTVYACSLFDIIETSSVCIDSSAYRRLH